MPTSRGGLPDPCITPVRDRFTRPASNNITEDDYIDISINAPNCQLYFTTDGARPAPFKRWIGNREVTFKYKGPFTLRGGKRVVRAVAVSRDKLLESTVVSRTFIVHGDGYDTPDSDTSFSEEDRSDFYWDTDRTESSRQKWIPCKSWTRRGNSPSRSRPASADQGWIASTRRYPYVVETLGREETAHPKPTVQIPDGPFNPVNYSGTQINVWGAPPGSVWPASPGMGTYGNMPQATHYPVRHGLLTKQTTKNADASESSTAEDYRPLTVADARRIIAESEAETSPPEPSESPESSGEKKRGVRSGNVSFSALSRSGNALLSTYRSKKKK